MILNLASDGVLSVLLALRRALIVQGPMPRQRLLDLCAPTSLRLGETEPAEAGELDEDPEPVAANSVQGPARKTLTRWCQAGLFIAADDEARTISLAPMFQKAELELNDLGPVRTTIRRVALDPRNNLDIAAASQKTAVAGVCGDFTRALGWVLAQDVYTFPGDANFGRVQELENEQFGSKKGDAQTEQRFYVFQNSTRWRGFRAWAPFLGFGWLTKELHLVIDPTEALADELPKVFGEAQEMTVGAFVARVAEELPVLDAGTYHGMLERILQRSAAWQAQARHELSTGLSRAILRLSEAGALELYDRSDAPERRALLGRGATVLGQVTHLARRRRSR